MVSPKLLLKIHKQLFEIFGLSKQQTKYISLEKIFQFVVIYIKTAKLHTLRALVRYAPRASPIPVPHPPSALRAPAPHMPRALSAFALHAPRALHAPVPHSLSCVVLYPLSCLTCPVLLVFSCLTYFLPYALSCDSAFSDLYNFLNIQL